MREGRVTLQQKESHNDRIIVLRQHHDKMYGVYVTPF